MCSAAGAGVFSASQAGLVLSIGTAATQGFIASTAGALFSGQSVISSFKAGLRGALLSGAQGVTGAASEGVFGKWASSITDVRFASTGLEVVRESNALVREVFGIAAQSVANGGLQEIFGGEFKNGFKGTLLPGLGRLGFEYASTEVLVAWWNANRETILSPAKNPRGALNTPMKVRALLSSPMISLRTAVAAGDPEGYKELLGVPFFDVRVNNVGIPPVGGESATTTFFTRENGAFLSAVGMYLPGFNAVSLAHDAFANQGEVLFGKGTFMASFNSLSSIPPFMYGVTSTAGYRDLRTTALTARR